MTAPATSTPREPAAAGPLAAFLACDDPLAFPAPRFDAWLAEFGRRRNAAFSTAEFYAAHGLHVLPIDGASKLPHPCLPGAGDGPGPDGKSGFYNATDDIAQLAHWFTDYPDAGIGVACKASQIIAFEIEGAAKGGDPITCIEQIAAECGDLPLTWHSVTPSGGVHLIYRWPQGVPAPTRIPGHKRFVQYGLDALKRDGLIVMPTDYVGRCRHGRRLASPATREIAQAPAWLVTHARQIEARAQIERASRRPRTEWTGPPDADLTARARDELRALGIHAKALAEGSRHNAVIWFGLEARRLHEGGRIRTREYVEGAIASIAAEVGLTTGARARRGELEGILAHVFSKDVDPI